MAFDSGERRHTPSGSPGRSATSSASKRRTAADTKAEREALERECQELVREHWQSIEAGWDVRHRGWIWTFGLSSDWHDEWLVLHAARMDHDGLYGCVCFIPGKMRDIAWDDRGFT